MIGSCSTRWIAVTKKLDQAQQDAYQSLGPFPPAVFKYISMC